MAAEIASTHGGPGWAPRSGDLETDLRTGRRWARCGVDDEVGTLEAVLLVRPPASLAGVDDPARHLMLGPVDLGAMRDEADALEEVYRDLGVKVQTFVPPPEAPPNIVFARDLFVMTKEGAIVGRMASEQRAGEEVHVTAALAAAAVPILRTIGGSATMEGADVLWLRSDLVLVGTGFRTDGGAVAALRSVLADQGVEVWTVPLPPGVQHLLGTMVPLDHDVVVVDPGRSGPVLVETLRRAGYRTIEGPHEEDERRGRGLNVVTVAPRRVLMPAGNPGTRRLLEGAGVDVAEVAIPNHVLAGGGIGCLTGILGRERSGIRRDRAGSLN